MGRKDLKMEESVTYQAILAKGEQQGRLKEAKKLLLLWGRRRFDPPSGAMEAIIEEVNELSRIESWLLRLQEESSWETLLAAPSSQPRRRKQAP